MLYGIQSVQFIRIIICYTRVLVLIINHATRIALFQSIPNILVCTYPTLTLQKLVCNTKRIRNMPRTPTVFELLVDEYCSI